MNIPRNTPERISAAPHEDPSSSKLDECVADLRLQKDRYRAFIEFLPDPVFVFNLDNTVSYLNPAFERVFGWTMKEWRGKTIPFIPEHLTGQTREVVKQLFRDKVIHGFETQRLTRDGRVIDVVIDGAVFYDEADQPAGKVVTYRDVTRQKRTDRSNQALFRIAKALYQFRGLDRRLDFVTRELRDLMSVEGALVILLDEEKSEFFFRAAAYSDSEAQKKYKETRYPIDKGVAGQVLRSGKPMIVPDYYNSPYFVDTVDQQTGFKTQNMLQVPMRTEESMIGTLCVVNKKKGPFDQADVDLLSAIASIVALPIVNARINEELEQSLEGVKSLNRAKDRFIHQLSHELKTPISVLDASVSLLSKKLGEAEIGGTEKILARVHRNLGRILEMQYSIEDILHEKDHAGYGLMNVLLDACIDELESLVADETGSEDLQQRIRKRIEDLFGPKNAVPETVRLDRFVTRQIETLQRQMAHRRCRLVSNVSAVPAISIPPEVLDKVIGGLIRNAVENTPDDGKIIVTVDGYKDCARMTVRDYGVGITRENQRLIFENYFTSYETLGYATKQPFDFGAGGKGFDLLRMKIFSERYHFDIHMTSERCRYIPKADDVCPGDIRRCRHCKSESDCHSSGGTTVQMIFPTAESLKAGVAPGDACRD